MIVDANFLLDTLVRDRKRHRRASQIVKELRDRGDRAEIAAATLHEVVYALSAPRLKNGYGRKRPDVCNDIEAILEEHAFVCAEEQVLRSAAELYLESRLDFHDCYLSALAETKSTTLLSFDRALAKWGSVAPLIGEVR